MVFHRYFTKTLRLPKLKHRVRLVILWDRKNGREAVKFLLTNRVHWEISRILNVYRKRWTGTETFHRDGKHHLGMGDGQLRSGEGQTRHRYLVMLTHSLLRARRRQGRARDWAHTVLTTIGEACRAVSRETLSKTITWAVEQAITVGWTQERIVAHLKLVQKRGVCKSPVRNLRSPSRYTVESGSMKTTPPAPRYPLLSQASPVLKSISTTAPSTCTPSMLV